MKLSGWGRYPVEDAVLHAPRTVEGVIQRIQAGRAIARGNGRAYGDSAISRSNTIHMRHFNRMLAFDAQSGQLVAEAGVLLGDIIRTYLPQGWFPAVTPGTKFVTLGGIIAADVHGKNHHKDGSFGNFVDWIDLIDGQGNIQRCSRKENTELFEWTIGGMGLTGIILRAAIRLRHVETGWIRQRVIAAENIDMAMDAFARASDATYSVAWMDCLKQGKGLGRSLVVLGEHATIADLPPRRRKAPLAVAQKRKLLVPFDCPAWLLNHWSVKAFNAMRYWHGQRKQAETLIDWDSYFYPLDSILNWNRIYGRKGFVQFQCVIPLKQARKGLHTLLDAISDAGTGAFLAVLKRFGAQNNRFSFPMEGYTLALDFPVNARTLALMTQLDDITLAHNGRFYLAKDSRMSRTTLMRSDARAKKFATWRKQANMHTTFSSSQSERLGL